MNHSNVTLKFPLLLKLIALFICRAVFIQNLEQVNFIGFNCLCISCESIDILDGEISAFVHQEVYGIHVSEYCSVLSWCPTTLILDID